jgi:predicted alpha/beta hydrolase family esterase
MKNAILVPGRPDRDVYYDPSRPTNSNDYWFPWLSKQLMMKDIFTVSLEIPNPWQPRYDVWKKELERFELMPDTLLVGHSCGGGFLVRYLSENQGLHVGRVILVAPWVNPNNKPHSDTADFFMFDMDKKIASRTKGLSVFYSTDDSSDVLKTVDLIRQNIEGIRFREFSDKGHFMIGDLGSVEFPELVEECLR